jgi:hypothetical protein
MATYYFRNTGTGVWGTATNWSLTSGGGATGAVPTVSDTAVFDNNSISCTLNTSNRVCLELSATTYTNTLALTTFNLTVSGNINLGTNMTITTSTGTLIVNANSTLTSNNKTLTVPFAAQTAGISLTFADNWIFDSGFTITGTLIGPITGKTSSLGVRKKVTISQGTTYSIDFCTALDLDSGDGLTAWNYKGTQSNCINWKDMPTQPTVISSNI